ncbi:hypothetical protein WDZ92_53670, partial [Nostoc sp. NIES-2111]
MAYSVITKVGSFGVCQDVGKPHLYVSSYVPETKTMVYRSLHTTSIEEAIVTVRDLVERGITGDPADALAKKALRTVADVLEFYAPILAELASAEFGLIATNRMKRLMGNALLHRMVRSDFDEFRDASLKEGIAL